MSQNTLQVPFDHPGRSCHRLEQLPGLFFHRLDPSTPVPQKLSGLSHGLPLVNTLKHKPHLVSYARHTPFQRHRISLLGFLLRPVHPDLEPHPPRSFQGVPFPSVTPALGLPDLVTRLHHDLNGVELVAHHLRVAEVVAHALNLGSAHVDGHILNGLEMAVVLLQFYSKRLPNRGILAGRGEGYSLGHQVREPRQIVVAFPPVHLIGPHPYHLVEAQPRMRRLDVGGEHPPHRRVALAKDVASTLDRHLPHQGQGEGLELLGKVLAAPLLGRSHTVHIDVIVTLAPRQRADDHALLVEYVEAPPLHRLNMVVTDHRRASPYTFLRTQIKRLFYLQKGGRRLRLKPRLHHPSCLAKPQQLSKGLFRCHRSA
jgi:hypothetical protein